MSSEFTVRLSRRPSIWSDFRGRLLFALIWTAGLGVLSWLAWTRRAGTPDFAIALVVIFDLITFAVLRDIAVCFWCTLHGCEPRVEIDHEALSYGESASVRVTEPHAESIAELAVKLVGECWSKSMTDVSRFRRTERAYSRCYEQELLRVAPDSRGPATQMVTVQLPKSAPADDVCWTLVIDSRLKEGGVVEHPFPLHVRETIA